MSNYTVEATTRFLAKYRELENFDNKRLEKFKKLYRDEFDMYRNIRNCLTHDEYNGDYPFAVAEELVDSLEEMIRIMNYTAEEVCITVDRLITASLDDRLIDAIKVLSRRNFSHLPILDEEGKVQYVFSEQSIMEILSAGKYSKARPLSEFTDFFGLENKNELFLFVKKEELAVNVKEMFEIRDALKRCQLIFVSEDGTKDSRLFGIITPHDVLEI